jgi:hypothetical protein
MNNVELKKVQLLMKIFSVLMLTVVNVDTRTVYLLI